MKQKIITIVLILITVLAPLLITPIIVNPNYIYNYHKQLVLLSGGALLLIMLFLNIKEIKLDKKDYLVLIFLGLIIISTCLSSNLKVSILGQRQRQEGMLMFATYIIIYLCSKKFLQIENKKIVLNILFYAFMMIGILGIMQKYVSKGTINIFGNIYNLKKLVPIFNKGVCGTFGNSNFFGSFITIVLPISICIFLFNSSKKSLMLSLVMFFNMISSGTRSAWVAFIVYTIFIIIYLIKNKDKQFLKRAALLLICFVIIFIYLFNGFSFIKNIKKSKEVEPKKVTTTTSIKISQTGREVQTAIKTNNFDKIASGRGKIWRYTVVVISKKPILGCGPDNLRDAINFYCKEEVEHGVENGEKYSDKAHNEYLQIAATIGVPACIIYLTFLSLIVFPNMKKMFNNRTIFIILIAIIGYLAQAFFNISTIGVAPLFWMLIGIIDNKKITDVLNLY